MRTRLIMALALIVPCLSASANTLVNYAIQGYGSVYVPTSPWDGQTLQETTEGVATFDTANQTFTKFEFSTYEGTTDYPGTQPNADPCDPDPIYWCLGVYGDSENGFTFNFYDSEYMVFFPDDYDRINEQYYGSLTPMSPTPEPSGILLLGTGLLCAALPIKRHFA